MIGTVNRLRIEPRPEFAKIVRVSESYAVRDGGSPAARINARFDRLIVQSGTRLAPGVVLQLCLLGAIACGGALFVASENLLATAGGVAVGALLPIAGLIRARTSRQQQLRRQLPVLISQLTRAAVAGRGLTTSLELATAETPAPLGEELSRVVARIRMGLGVEAALEGLPERTGLPEMNNFVAALAAHDRTGSDLISLLDGLAETVAMPV